MYLGDVILIFEHCMSEMRGLLILSYSRQVRKKVEHFDTLASACRTPVAVANEGEGSSLWLKVKRSEHFQFSYRRSMRVISKVLGNLPIAVPKRTGQNGCVI